MKRKFMQFVLLVLAAVLLVPVSPARAAGDEKNPMIRVGLWYGSNAMAAANLKNGVGTGYRFGYFDAALNFLQVGYTAETDLSMLKNQNMYLAGGAYTDVQPSAGEEIIGGYHLQLPEKYASFEKAAAAAAGVGGGFPAWIDGAYYVRAGTYPSSGAAQLLQTKLPGSTVTEPSSSGVSVLKTGTSTILFQFDGGLANSFAVQPGMEDTVQAVTWFKGFKYSGSFQYQRLGGGNLTVSNILLLEDYLKGVLPAELGNDWPLETLKAQAVCARNYAMKKYREAKHTKEGFDICNTVDCQGYQGLNKAGANTDRAVAETCGMFARYNGAIIETTYASSDGGATEDAGNVWTSDLPYLKGVIDPYEATIADRIPGYYWTVTFTRQQLTDRLNRAGYINAGIVDFYVSEFTPLGNVKSICFADSAGKTRTFSKESARTLLGLNSLRYTVTGGSGTAGEPAKGYYVDGGDVLSTVAGTYVIDGTGTIAPVSEAPYLVTKDGVAALTPPVAAGTTDPAVPIGTVGGDVFTVTGTGKGHNVGMSQWGANAMAKAGKTYDEILKFYFTGIEIN